MGGISRVLGRAAELGLVGLVRVEHRNLTCSREGHVKVAGFAEDDSVGTGTRIGEVIGVEDVQVRQSWMIDQREGVNVAGAPPSKVTVK